MNRYIRAKGAEFEILDRARIEGAALQEDLETRLAQKIVKEYADARKRAPKGKK